jgi:hypothetical protein
MLTCSASHNQIQLIEVGPTGLLTDRGSVTNGGAASDGSGAVAFNPSWPRAGSINLDGSFSEYDVSVDNSGNVSFARLAQNAGVLSAAYPRGYDVVFRNDGARAYAVAAPATLGGPNWELVEIELDDLSGDYLSTIGRTEYTDTLAPIPGLRQLAVNDLGRRLFVNAFTRVLVFSIDGVSPGVPSAIAPTLGAAMSMCARSR